jgi:hypothetical protein
LRMKVLVDKYSKLIGFHDLVGCTALFSSPSVDFCSRDNMIPFSRKNQKFELKNKIKIWCLDIRVRYASKFLEKKHSFEV